MSSLDEQEEGAQDEEDSESEDDEGTVGVRQQR
jgi:hypothetical protein